MNEQAIQQIIRDIMARATAASGTAVFVDPVILRAIIERALRTTE